MNFRTKYIPLVDADDTGLSKVPLFFSYGEEDVRSQHDFYLEEYEKGSFALHSRKHLIPSDYMVLRIHCPLCGKVMTPDTTHPLSNNLVSYKCRRCS